MNTTYLLIILLNSTVTNTNIGAQAFELNSASECIEMRDYAVKQFQLNLPKEVEGHAACFRNLGGKGKEV